MIKKSLIKTTGATFTPKPLADFLSKKILSYVNKDHLEILDPSCGDGELLLSIGEQLVDNNFSFTINGCDYNESYLRIAEERTSKFGKGKSVYIHGNFLENNIQENQMTIDFDGKIESLKKFDIVIANPPYVRTQILGSGQAQALAKKYGLNGRVDLYYPFLISMTSSLKENGILGVITSNKYLITKSGESIRKFLSENYEILEIIDLGDTKLFGAAVLPSIFVGRKKTVHRKKGLSYFTKIYEEFSKEYRGSKQIENIYELLNDIKSNNETAFYDLNKKIFRKTTGILNYQPKKGNIWELLSESENDWINKINSNTFCTVGDLFKVRVGIKTTADKVFISSDWDVLDVKPEEELLKDLISQENINAWTKKDKQHLKVLYPYFNENGKKVTIDLNNFPNAKKYFISNEIQLRGRKYVEESGKQWFEIWVSHHPGIWDYPKIVFPDISLSPRFYFDQQGKIVNGNCYWIVAKNEKETRLLLLIQALANTKLMTKYHDLVFNNKLYNGRRRYISQFVEKYPLPNPESDISNEIISIARKLNEKLDVKIFNNLRSELEIKVAAAFDVIPVLE